MKRFVAAAVCTLGLVGLVMAEDFNLQITKIGDDGTVTGTKAAAKGGKGGKGEAVTIKLATGAKIYKGKFDTDKKAFVQEGDDLGLTGLKSAFKEVDRSKVTVDGNALTDKDTLELTVKDGVPAAKLNGKEIDMNTVKVAGKGPLTTRVTTGDDGAISTILITTGKKKG